MGRQKRKHECVEYVRLHPNCGCVGDGTGFMISITMIDKCRCPRCLKNPCYTAWAGLNGEFAQSLVKDLNDNCHNIKFELLPGVFSLFWYKNHDNPVKAKWISVEEYRVSQEAKDVSYPCLKRKQ
jgi:hypothetical protein